MALHAIGPKGVGDLTMRAFSIVHGVIEDRASSVFIRRKTPQNIADLVGRTQVDGAIIAAGEEAGHFLHCDIGIARIARLNGVEHGSQPSAAPMLTAASNATTASGVLGR